MRREEGERYQFSRTRSPRRKMSGSEQKAARKHHPERTPLLVTAILIAFVSFIAWPNVVAISRGVRTRFQPVTQATIVGHGASTERVRHRGQDTPVGVLQVDYIYEAGGQLWKGVGIDSSSYGRPAALQLGLRKYPLGSTHEVHYDGTLKSGSRLLPLATADGSGTEGWLFIIFHLMAAGLIFPVVLLFVLKTDARPWLLLVSVVCSAAFGIWASYRLGLSPPPLPSDLALSPSQDVRPIVKEFADIQAAKGMLTVGPGLSARALAEALGPPLSLSISQTGLLVITMGDKAKAVSFSRVSPESPFLSVPQTR